MVCEWGKGDELLRVRDRIGNSATIAGKIMEKYLRVLLDFFSKSWERRVPLALVCIVLGVVGGFFEFASEIRENETQRFDEAVMMLVREPGDLSKPVGSARMGEIARDLTALGGVTVLTIVTLVSFGVAVFSGRTKLGWLGIFAVAAGTVATRFLKHGYNRPRPDIFEHGAWTYTASFPSGHSMMSAVVYLTLGILVARIQRRRSVRWFITSISVLLTLLVGLSRIYLGVHWPTDVAGGWMLGGAWAILFWLVAMKVDPIARDHSGRS